MQVRALTVAETASRLGVNETRVKALIRRKELEAVKVGGRWLIDPDAVERRHRAAPPAGRAFQPATAWAAIFIASGLKPRPLTSSTRANVEAWLASGDLVREPGRLRQRARTTRFRAHPADVPRMAVDPHVVLTGASAERRVDDDDQELHAYVSRVEMGRLERVYALEPGSVHPNVQLEVVDGPWPFTARTRIAPRAAVAIDLLSRPEPRYQAEGRRVLEELQLPSTGAPPIRKGARATR